ncbi:MAG: cyclic nucleotide-binding domain-containing protein [SAR324 cluster bacterium]|nr:cyclic nucleotide-binding domain-containing protein [SAR324 cluster bacterium]
MLNDPQSNYLKNTIPELEDQFIEVIGDIPLFSQLSSNLRHQLFQYSKFTKLKAREYAIEQGMFDQEIFVLLRGRLNVLIQDNVGNESLIDVMEQPFTLFGERSLLGEQRGASIQADDEVLLLGIDLSSLPDILDGMENPESREDDEVYQQNVKMYTIFATVLTERLERLVRDQYKLKQKVREFQKRQSFWTEEWMLARIFNQLASDELPQIPEIRDILHKQLKKYQISPPTLREILLSRKISTRRFYMEMVRLNALGEFDQLNNIVLDSVYEITAYLQTHPDFNNLFEISLLEIHDIPAMTTLPDFLNTLYHSMTEANILVKPLPKVKFLNAILTEKGVQTVAFLNFLQEDGWCKDNFSLAYVVYLVCQSSIYVISEANQKIRDYVNFLVTYSTPKQASQVSADQSHALIEQLAEMQEQQKASLPQEKSQPAEPESAQGAADDLLSSLGL